MKVLWIGSLAWIRKGSNFPYPINGSGAISGCLFEQEMITGLESIGVEIDILCSYPYGDNKNHSAFSWSHNGKANDFCIKHKKNKYLNIISESLSLKKFISKSSKNMQYDAVIVYLVHLPFLQAIKKFKLLFPLSSTTLICPDLSDMMDLGLDRNLIKLLLKRIEARCLSKCYRYVDKYVLFSKYMSEQLPVESKQIIVIEGVNSIRNAQKYIERDNELNKYIVLYAGSLQFNFGLENIIEAFNLISDDRIELHVYGNGPLANYIEQKAKVNSQIKYFGFVDHDKLIEIERASNLLINARDPNSLYTRYSFPSKTFEYMMSGVPFLTTKLRGIPEEYYEFLFLINDNSPNTIMEAIMSIMSMNSGLIKKKVDSGIEFIEKNKNNIIQANRLLDFVKG